MARKSGSDSKVTGDRIRGAALRLIARHGFAAVSMRQIAAEAGVQAGAIYLHVADKQTLLFELMDAHLDTLLAAWRKVKLDPDPGTRLRAFTDFHIAFHLDRPDAVFVAYMELRNLSPENFRVIEAKRRAYEAELEAILDYGRQEGAFRFPDLRIVSMAVIGMLTGISTWYRDDGRLNRAKVSRVYGRLVRRMAGRGPGKPRPPEDRGGAAKDA